MRSGLIFTHDLCVGRRRGLEDIGIDTFLFQDTIGAFFVSYGTDNAFKGISEPSPEGRAFIYVGRIRGSNAVIPNLNCL
jgi:hypothetical protein